MCLGLTERNFSKPQLYLPKTACFPPDAGGFYLPKADFIKLNLGFAKMKPSLRSDEIGNSPMKSLLCKGYIAWVNPSASHTLSTSPYTGEASFLLCRATVCAHSIPFPFPSLLDLGFASRCSRIGREKQLRSKLPFVSRPCVMGDKLKTFDNRF